MQFCSIKRFDILLLNKTVLEIILFSYFPSMVLSCFYQKPNPSPIPIINGGHTTLKESMSTGWRGFDCLQLLTFQTNVHHNQDACCYCCHKGTNCNRPKILKTTYIVKNSVTRAKRYIGGALMYHVSTPAGCTLLCLPTLGVPNQVRGVSVAAVTTIHTQIVR